MLDPKILYSKNYPHFGYQNRFFYLFFIWLVVSFTRFTPDDLWVFFLVHEISEMRLISCNPVVLLWSRTIRKIKFVLVTLKNIKKIGKERICRERHHRPGVYFLNSLSQSPCVSKPLRGHKNASVQKRVFPYLINSLHTTTSCVAGLVIYLLMPLHCSF